VHAGRARGRLAGAAPSSSLAASCQAQQWALRAPLCSGDALLMQGVEGCLQL